jgi:hypothetical protein
MQQSRISKAGQKESSLGYALKKEKVQEKQRL